VGTNTRKYPTLVTNRKNLPSLRPYNWARVGNAAAIIKQREIEMVRSIPTGSMGISHGQGRRVDTLFCHKVPRTLAMCSSNTMMTREAI
jgi:hypothetical protein